MKQISDKEVLRLSSLVLALQDFVDKLKSRGVKVSPGQQAKIDKCRAERICMVCGQPLISERDTRRGTHHQSCYNGIWNQIRKGEITEQEAVDAGDWNPVAEKPGRKSRRQKATHANAVKALAKAKKAGKNSGTKDGTRSP